MKSSVKKIFVYSLIATFSLFSLTMTAILFCYKTTLNSTNQSLNDYAIETIHSSIEDAFTSIYSACGELFMDAEESGVGAISNQAEYYSSKGTFSLIEKIKFYESLSNISLVYIYFPDTDTIICSRGLYTARGYYDMLFSKSELSFEEWNNNLLDTTSAYNYYSISIFDHNSRSSDSAITIDSHATTSSNRRIIISAGAYVDILLKSIKETEAYDRCSVTVLDNGRSFDVLKNSTLDTTSNYVFSAGKNISTNSSIVSISISTPINFMAKNIQLINTTLTILFIFMVLFALSSVIFIIMNNYRSISSIFRQFELDVNTSNYKSLMKSIETTQAHHMAVKAKLNAQGYQAILLDVLSGNTPSTEVLESHKIFFRNSGFFVVGIFVADFDTANDNSSQPSAEEIKSIISNVFEEKFSDTNLEGYVTHSSKTSYCLINSALYTTNTQNKIKSDVEQCAEYISKHFNIHLCAAVSNAADSVNNIPLAFDSVQKTISQMIFHHVGGGVIADSSSQMAISDKYIFSSDVEYRLSEAISNENVFEIHGIISSIFSELDANESADTDYQKGILINIASFILRQISAPPSMFQSTFSTLLSINSLKDEEKFFRNLIDTLFSGSDIAAKTIETSSISSKIIQYITKNYKNPDLNNSMIGDHFGLSAGYIARIFKAEYGESILEFIHEYRISRAKKLLRSADMSVNAVSELTGFQHIRSFNRIFKKHEGITPSEYIQTLSRNDEEQ